MKFIFDLLNLNYFQLALVSRFNENHLQLKSAEALNKTEKRVLSFVNIYPGRHSFRKEKSAGN